MIGKANRHLPAGKDAAADGRKDRTDFTPSETQRRLVRHFRDKDYNSTIVSACAACRIGRQTFYDWHGDAGFRAWWAGSDRPAFLSDTRAHHGGVVRRSHHAENAFGAARQHGRGTHSARALRRGICPAESEGHASGNSRLVRGLAQRPRSPGGRVTGREGTVRGRQCDHRCGHGRAIVTAQRHRVRRRVCPRIMSAPCLEEVAAIGLLCLNVPFAGRD